MYEIVIERLNRSHHTVARTKNQTVARRMATIWAKQQGLTPIGHWACNKRWFIDNQRKVADVRLIFHENL